MPRKYPSLTPSEVRAILQARTFVKKGQRGSHEQWAGVWAGNPRVVTVDGHYPEFDDDLIKSMIRQSGMTREQFYGATDRTARKIGLRG